MVYDCKTPRGETVAPLDELSPPGVILDTPERAPAAGANLIFSACAVTWAQQAIKTGPEVGSTLPSFEAPDQNGRLAELCRAFLVRKARYWFFTVRRTGDRSAKPSSSSWNSISAISVNKAWGWPRSAMTAWPCSRTLRTESILLIPCFLIPIPKSFALSGF